MAQKVCWQTKRKLSLVEAQTENVYNMMDWGFFIGEAIPQLELATTHGIVNNDRSDWSAQGQEQADFPG